MLKLSAFFDNFFSKYQFGFWKGYSTQHSLSIMLKKLKKCVDKGKVFGASLTHLSKAFDCLDHKLLYVTTCRIENKEQKLKILTALG